MEMNVDVSGRACWLSGTNYQYTCYYRTIITG